MRTSPNSGSRGWGLPLAVALAGMTLVFGCAQLIGATDERGLTELPATPETPNFVDASAPIVANVPEAGDPNACPATHKRCNGACVPKSEPKYGCGGVSCAPCSLPNAAVTKCTEDALLCGSGTCKPGFTACGPLTDGCTTDLTAATTCGGCNTPCAPADFCNPGGKCKASCDEGLTDCDHSCVDTETSALHCGTKGSPTACTTVCPSAPNGDAACKAGKCEIECRPGFGHCGNPATCVALTVFYADADGDGFGDVSQPTKLACDAVSAGAGFAPRAGDCEDSERLVNPGQTRYFATPYLSKKTGALSFDYNCDGVESETTGVAHFKPCGGDCAGSGLGPAGSGRVGGGVNDYCGSTQALKCEKGVVAAEPNGANLNSIRPLAEPVDPKACGVTGAATVANECH